MACFYPDGSRNDGLFACDPKAAVSACCRLGDVCVSNGFCFFAGLNALVRRGCTDSSFNSTSCPRACLGRCIFDLHEIKLIVPAPELRPADVLMIPCDNYNTFCCGQNEAARQCCSNGNGTVRIPAGSAVFPAGSNSTLTITSIVTTTATGAVNTVTVNADNANSHNRTTIGLGAGLGVALAVVSGLLLVTGLRLWRIDKEMRRMTGERVS